MSWSDLPPELREAIRRVCTAKQQEVILLAEGIALIVISAGSLVDAFVYAWPRERTIAISLRLLGRTLLVAFASWFVVHRLHDELNWYTPVVMLSLTCLLIGELDEPKERAALAGHGGAAFARGDEPL